VTHSVARIILIMSNDLYKTSYNFDEVKLMALGTYFGSDAPVLPMDEMLMIDGIEHVSLQGGKYGKGQVISTLTIHPKLWFFKCHFINDPVMPGCLGLDGMWQTLGFFLAWNRFDGKARALGVKELKFAGQVEPTNKKIRYIIDIKRLVDMKLKMVVADGSLEVDGNIVYSASDMRVGLFARNVPIS